MRREDRDVSVVSLNLPYVPVFTTALFSTLVFSIFDDPAQTYTHSDNTT